LVSEQPPRSVDVLHALWLHRLVALSLPRSARRVLLQELLSVEFVARVAECSAIGSSRESLVPVASLVVDVAFRLDLVKVGYLRLRGIYLGRCKGNFGHFFWSIHC
jgi:hypothetical protein